MPPTESQNIHPTTSLDASPESTKNSLKRPITDCIPMDQDEYSEDEFSDDSSVHMNSEDDEMDMDPKDLPEDDLNNPDAENKFKVYLPGQELNEDEELVVDNSAYEMLHHMGVEWPCLSFDILQDNLGNNRKDFPMTSYVVTGSQAEKADDNKIYIMKMSRLHRTKHEDDDDASDDDDNDIDENASLQYKTIDHDGGVNRIRAMPHPESHIIASWAETGKVHIYDISKHVKSLDSTSVELPRRTDPIYTVREHGNTEGYALDWSSLQPGHLLSGDCRGDIYLTTKTPNGFFTESEAFKGHTASVEDLQFSPAQLNVFASCSADKTIKIWDARTRNKPQLSIKAHDSDVNVISWNRSVNYLLASGSDSGEFSIWDLRSWPSATAQSPPIPAASFKWHSKPITSLDWHPIESSVLAVSGADDQVTLWDLALERDAEEEAELTAGTSGELSQVPAQLLFIHQGQKHIKEIKWHRQAPGVLISTAYDGFNILKTINS